MSILDVNTKTVMGVFWLGYGLGLAIASHWVTGAIFLVLGLLFVLLGEGLRLTWKR